MGTFLQKFICKKRLKDRGYFLLYWNMCKMQSKDLNKFDKKYWDEMYAKEDDAIIDGLDNAKEHAKYLKSILDLAQIPVLTLADFGFGKGILLREIANKFKPKRIIAIDPSLEAIVNLKKQKWIQNSKTTILHTTIQDIPISKIPKTLDLGIFNSILQYIPEKEINPVIKKLSLACKYLYFSVPTSVDYSMMRKEFGFVDPYAFSRTKSFYLKALSPYFTIVSCNLLESKIHIKDSGFSFELFKF
jgi:hypothetical protein